MAESESEAEGRHDNASCGDSSGGTPEDAPPPEMDDVKVEVTSTPTPAPTPTPNMLKYSAPPQRTTGVRTRNAKAPGNPQGGAVPRKTTPMSSSLNVPVKEFFDEENVSVDLDSMQQRARSAPKAASQTSGSINSGSSKGRTNKLCRHRIMRHLCTVCRGQNLPQNTVTQHAMLQSSLRESQAQAQTQPGRPQTADSMAKSVKSGISSASRRTPPSAKMFIPPEVNIRDHKRKMFSTLKLGAKVNIRTTMGELKQILDVQYDSTNVVTKLSVTNASSVAIPFDDGDLVCVQPERCVFTYAISTKTEGKACCTVQ